MCEGVRTTELDEAGRSPCQMIRVLGLTVTRTMFMVKRLISLTHMVPALRDKPQAGLRLILFN